MRRFLSSFGFAVVFSSLFVVPALALANTSISVGALSPSSTVSPGTAVSFTVAASGFNSPSFNVSDSFSSPSSSISNNDINSSGYFSWTPTTNDLGSHTITISVSDSSGNSGSVSETITVSNGPSVSIDSLLPGDTVVAGVPLTFYVNASGFSNPVYAIGDSFGNSVSSVSTSNINSSGYFSWTPTTNDVGAHTITISAVDSYGHSASQPLPITVLSPQVVVMSLTPGGTVASGQQLSFSIVPTGFTNPSFTLYDSFIGSTFPVGESPSNVIWIPALRDVGSHTITITANDNDNHAATDTITIAVTPGSAASVPTSAATGLSQTATVTAPTSSVTPAVSSAAFSEYLVSGSTGSQVTALQTLLARLGFFFVTPNGYFGPATKAAVSAFQSAHGLAAVGTVGPQTRALLNQANTVASYTFNSALSVGSTGAAVTALQNILSAAGVFSGEITGYFGAQTKAALEKFQTTHGLAAVGALGPQTRALLNK